MRHEQKTQNHQHQPQPQQDRRRRPCALRSLTSFHEIDEETTVLTVVTVLPKDRFDAAGVGEPEFPTGQLRDNNNKANTRTGPISKDHDRIESNDSHDNSNDYYYHHHQHYYSNSSSATRRPKAVRFNDENIAAVRVIISRDDITSKEKRAAYYTTEEMANMFVNASAEANSFVYSFLRQQQQRGLELCSHAGKIRSTRAHWAIQDAVLDLQEELEELHGHLWNIRRPTRVFAEAIANASLKVSRRSIREAFERARRDHQHAREYTTTISTA